MNGNSLFDLFQLGLLPGHCAETALATSLNDTLAQSVELIEQISMSIKLAYFLPVSYKTRQYLVIGVGLLVGFIQGCMKQHCKFFSTK